MTLQFQSKHPVAPHSPGESASHSGFGTEADNVGSWFFSVQHQEWCQVIETETLWGQTVYRVWLQAQQRVVGLDPARLKPPGSVTLSANALTYTVVAARVADSFTRDLPVAPIGARVMPLPHQIKALTRAMSADRVRFLLADEVGLGKTIEAGLILRELKLRGMVHRVLVVVPRGLVTQWIAEMRIHFGEEFRLLVPSDFPAYRRVAGDENIWRTHDQIICSMDSVKPSEGRRGWSTADVADYNRDRFEDLIAAGWDLVIVDEAHRLGGSSDQVARYRLGQGLAEAVPYVLLLSATPHQGKTDAFRRLLSLLDSKEFADADAVDRKKVEPYVIRAEKRRAVDSQGKPLFKPRLTRLVPVLWQDRHRKQRVLYEAVSAYVREGYNQAVREKKTYQAFLLILMQRLVTSSTRAIATTLERRLEALATPAEQTLFPAVVDEEWGDLDGQEQLDALLRWRLTALQNERAEVELLLEGARRSEAAGPDAKAEALLDWIYRLQQQEEDPEVKILVFTEFLPTQEMLKEFLIDRDFSVVCLNGSMDMGERAKVQDAFASHSRILVSTEAGGEGLNLQFCHVVVNYDIPWNPMRLEQRIGRVDRIGQAHAVRAINFALEETVEYRVREVLEEKLQVILEEFGADKAGDVLDSLQAAEIFDEVYREAILNPETMDTHVEAALGRVREAAGAHRETLSILGSEELASVEDSDRLLEHPLPHWVEQMTVSYLRAYGGRATRQRNTWQLVWPDGTQMEEAVFTSFEAARNPTAVHLTLQEPRVRDLAMRLPRFVPGQPVPKLVIQSLPADVTGVWSLWQIKIHTPSSGEQRFTPIFVHQDGRVLLPTARNVWDLLLTESPQPKAFINDETARNVFVTSRVTAEAEGRTLRDELLRLHQERLKRDHQKGEYAFAARKRVIQPQ